MAPERSGAPLPNKSSKKECGIGPSHEFVQKGLKPFELPPVVLDLITLAHMHRSMSAASMVGQAFYQGYVEAAEASADTVY